MNGSGTIVGGQMDANDNGNATNFCGTGPCSVSGTYTADARNQRAVAHDYNLLDQLLSWISISLLLPGPPVKRIR